MRLLAVIVVELAVLAIAFTYAPRATLAVLELAGIVGVVRLGWWMHTWPEHAWRPRRQSRINGEPS